MIKHLRGCTKPTWNDRGTSFFSGLIPDSIASAPTRAFKTSCAVSVSSSELKLRVCADPIFEGDTRPRSTTYVPLSRRDLRCNSDAKLSVTTRAISGGGVISCSRWGALRVVPGVYKRRRIRKDEVVTAI